MSGTVLEEKNIYPKIFPRKLWRVNVDTMYIEKEHQWVEINPLKTNWHVFARCTDEYSGKFVLYITIKSIYSRFRTVLAIKISPLRGKI